MLNLYRPTYAPEDPTTSEAAGKLLDEHLTNLFPQERHRKTLKSWMCHLVQFPGKKMMWAPVIQGAYGCGKSVLYDILRAALGTSNATKVDSRRFNSQWNDWSANKLLLCFEEVRLGRGDAGEAQRDMLKDLITGTSVTLSQRWANTRDVPNYANAMFLLNDLQAFSMPEDERRYFVLACAQQNRADVARLGGTKYFDRVWSLVSTLAGGVRHHLLHHPIDPDFDPQGPAPKTVFAGAAAATVTTPLHTCMQQAIDGHVAGLSHDFIDYEVLCGVVMLAMPDTNDVQMRAELARFGFFPTEDDPLIFVTTASGFVTAAEVAALAETQLSAVPEGPLLSPHHMRVDALAAALHCPRRALRALATARGLSACDEDGAVFLAPQMDLNTINALYA